MKKSPLEHPEINGGPRAILDKLLSSLYSEKAYHEDGLAPDEFNTYPVLMKTGA